MPNKETKDIGLRYPPGTPTWKIRYDYYMEVAKDAEKAGKTQKAKRYKAKADAVFIGAGGAKFDL